jgi:aminoglycoside phosphotransferase (APT) family kinase protein
MVTPTDLTTYLESRLDGARDIEVTSLARIPGGASRETWTFDATWREGDKFVERGFIMRRDPTGSLLESDRDVEFRIYQAMAKTGVPVPPMYWLEPTGANLQRPFFVMGRVAGQANAAVLMSPNYPGSREEIARQKASILAQIHRCDWKALGVDDFLGPAPSPIEAAAREIERWERIMRQDMLEPQPVLEMALRWLKRNQPAAPAVSIVHADYRTGNFLFDEHKITAILDWEMVHLGDPLEDVGWLGMRSWRQGTELAGGLVPHERFYAMYEEAGGFPVDRKAVFFWELLGNLKLVVIFLTGGRALVEGTTGDLILAMTTRMIPGLEREILTMLEAAP